MADDAEEDFYDSNDACRENSNMWRNIASECQARAYERLECSSAEHLDIALRYARAAEAARWQATGESETFDFAHHKIN